MYSFRLFNKNESSVLCMAHFRRHPLYNLISCVVVLPSTNYIYIVPRFYVLNTLVYYCVGTLSRHSWIHYTDCWILK